MKFILIVLILLLFVLSSCSPVSVVGTTADTGNAKLIADLGSYYQVWKITDASAHCYVVINSYSNDSSSISCIP